MSKPSQPNKSKEKIMDSSLVKILDKSGKTVRMMGLLPDGTYGIVADSRGICEHLNPLGHCPKGCKK